MSARDLNMICRSLRDGGYIKEATNCRKKGFSRTGKPYYIVNRTDDQAILLLLEYFDPTLTIRMKVSIPTLMNTF